LPNERYRLRHTLVSTAGLSPGQLQPLSPCATGWQKQCCRCVLGRTQLLIEAADSWACSRVPQTEMCGIVGWPEHSARVGHYGDDGVLLATSQLQIRGA
jgi:hypothetical protein